MDTAALRDRLLGAGVRAALETGLYTGRLTLRERKTQVVWEELETWASIAAHRRSHGRVRARALGTLRGGAGGQGRGIQQSRLNSPLDLIL